MEIWKPASGADGQPLRPSAGSSGWLGAELVLLALTVAIQVPLILNADLGWLLTACEKLLAGQRLYVDVVELNPPLSVFLYLPAAFVAAKLGVPGHIVVIAMMVALIWASASLTVRILSPFLSSDVARHRARFILLFCMALLPGATFGQREHIAVLGLAPFVALAAVVGDRSVPPPPSWLRVTAGLCAGLAMSIKPHFALAAGLPLLWNAAKARSLKPLFGLETWTASVVVLGYFSWAYLTFPNYFNVYARWAAIVYIPNREPLAHFFGSLTLSCAALLGVMLWATRGSQREDWRGAAPWLLAALGGFLSYVIQGKHFSYTKLPTAEFAMLAVLLAPAVLEKAPLRSTMGSVKAALVVVGALQLVLWITPEYNSFAPLREPIRSIAPPRPKLLAVTANVGVGEPLTHKLDAEWVSGAGSQLLSGSAIEMLKAGKLDAKGTAVAHQIIASERSRLRRDLLGGRPDVLLFDSMLRDKSFHWEAWARTDPVISSELDRHYRFVRKMGRISIWARRPN